jgi:hypothetical protein
MEARRLRAGAAIVMAASTEANKFFTDTAAFKAGGWGGAALGRGRGGEGVCWATGCGWATEPCTEPSPSEQR